VHDARVTVRVEFPGVAEAVTWLGFLMNAPLKTTGPSAKIISIVSGMRTWHCMYS